MDAWERKGRDEALRILEDEFKDYSYKMIVTEEKYIDWGEQYATYNLEVHGENYTYRTAGDKNNSDDQYFYENKK